MGGCKGEGPVNYISYLAHILRLRPDGEYCLGCRTYDMQFYLNPPQGRPPQWGSRRALKCVVMGVPITIRDKTSPGMAIELSHPQ